MVRRRAFNSAVVILLAYFLWLQPSLLVEVMTVAHIGTFGSWLARLGEVSHDWRVSNHSQRRSYQGRWNILRHMGGNSPWIQKLDGIVEGGIEVPAGCRVDQIHMMSRHAERYPTVQAGIRMLELYHRLQNANVSVNGTLAFTDQWDFFTGEPGKHFENLVSVGPYAGTLGAFATGVRLRTRYKQLLHEALTRSQTSFWASGSKRVIDTARYFGAGFYGIDWQDIATLHVIPETSDLGADTLTPGDTCLDYANNIDDHGHNYGARMLSAFRSSYLRTISERLAEENPGLPFSDDELYTMQEICGFETIAKGSSPWCNVFSRAEWESFEYARDLLHYYRSGPGNPYGAAMGWLWLNATANLLEKGSEAGPLFFSFVHDGDIVPLLAALDLFVQVVDLPTTHVMRNRTWRTSDVVPMGGRIIFERLECVAEQLCWTNALFYPNHVYCEPMRHDLFVRINVNDGIVALPGCDDGPGRSCELQAFVEGVRKRGEEVGDFGRVCSLEEEAAKGITFLHQ